MFSFFQRDLYDREKSVMEMTDEELIQEISNWMDVSEETVFEIARLETGSQMTYNDFFRTTKLDPDMRHELRSAYPEVLKNFS